MTKFLLTGLLALGVSRAAQAAPDPECQHLDDPALDAPASWQIVDLSAGNAMIRYCTPLYTAAGERYSDNVALVPYPITQCVVSIGTTVFSDPANKPGQAVTILASTVTFQSGTGAMVGSAGCDAGTVVGPRAAIHIAIVPVSEAPGLPLQLVP